MSEKRFHMNFGKYAHQIMCDGEGLSLQETVKILNELVIKCHMLEKENRELNSIKKFAERNGINIFLIEEAFRKCWKDNKKLIEENEQLRKVCSCLKKENQRQKTLRNKHWREIQARANAYNRIISSLEDIIPQPMIEELRNAPLLDCDYEGVESNE